MSFEDIEVARAARAAKVVIKGKRKRGGKRKSAALEADDPETEPTTTGLSLSGAMTYPEHCGTCTREGGARTSLGYVIALDLVSARVEGRVKTLVSCHRF